MRRKKKGREREKREGGREKGGREGEKREGGRERIEMFFRLYEDECIHSISFSESD